jgi:flagellar motility protein MotE (MotC chaperone)
MAAIRDFQLIPVVALAAGSLFALKVFGLVVDGGYVFAEGDASDQAELAAPTIAKSAPPATISTPVRTKYLQARDLLNLFDITGATDAQKSTATPAKTEDAAPAKSDGSSPAKADGTAPTKAEEPASSKADAAKTQGAAGSKSKPADPPPNPGGAVIQVEGDHPVSPAERAILEHLQARRQELETRAREIEIRNNLLKEAEGRLEARASELKDLQGQINAANQKKDEADAARLKGLVIMYENMKPKDAAKIFDRLDMKILVELVTQINPRRMSDILAQMQPEMAERLTAELAAKGAGADRGQSIDSLPKIDGKPPEADANPENSANPANPNGT